MRPIKRRPVNKQRSSRKFANNTRRTKAANLMPQRGGYRL